MGDSIISFTACACGFSSLQPASNSMNKSTDALVIMGLSDLQQIQAPYGGGRDEAAHISSKVPLVTQNWRVVRFPEMGWVGSAHSKTNS
jgi:hypothetical protein